MHKRQSGIVENQYDLLLYYSEGEKCESKKIKQR